MRNFSYICVGLWLCGLLLGAARGETYQLTDGQTLTGDIVSFNESGLVVRQDDKYSDRTSWTKFSQDDLKKLAQNPKIAPLVEPFIEVPVAQVVKRIAVEINAPPRLERPEARSLLGAMFTSGVGLFVLFLMYAANLFAAYEIASFRARPVVLVCGVSALIPLFGPIIFLAIPAPAKAEEVEEAPPELVKTTQVGGAPGSIGATRFTPPATSGIPRPTAATAAPVAGQSSLRLSAEPEPASSTAPLPKTQVFQRGAFTFNRRFFETKFPGFFGVVRRDDENKDQVLVIKAARGEFIVQRITRIAANDLHAQVHKGNASEEIMIPFTEIKEINLKHKDA